MQFLSEWTRGPLCLSAPAPGQYAGVCGLLLSFANIGMLPLYGAPRFRGGSTGQCMLCGYTVPLSSLHVLAWLPFLNSGLGLPCVVIMVSPWVSALSCHSSLFGTCIPAALVCIPCMLVPVPLATTGRTLHALEPGLGGAGVWLYGVLHVLLCQVLVLPACLSSRSFFAVVGHGALVLAFSALLLIYASSFSWAVPLRGPKRERYTVVLAPPPCKIPTTTTTNRPGAGRWVVGSGVVAAGSRSGGLLI